MKNQNLYLGMGLAAILFASQNQNEGSTNKTPRNVKRRIIKDAEKIFRKKYSHMCSMDNPGGYCPLWALAVVEAGAKNGRKLVIMAGSMQWRIVPEHLDDGVMNNAFAYMWSPDDPQSRMAMRMGLLPEVHVFAGDPETQEFIDLSTRDFKRIAENKFGLKWLTPPPPRYVWGKINEIPSDANYMPNRDATLFVISKLSKMGLFPPRGSSNLSATFFS